MRCDDKDKNFRSRYVGHALIRMISIYDHDITVWSAMPPEIEELSQNRKQK